jgi:hypothetical protein
MLRTLIIGDSSSLSRDNILFDDTYYAELKKQITIENSAVPNNNSYRIYSDLEAFMLYGYAPHTVILNYGIVDVYPRPYPNLIYKLLSCSGLLSTIDNILKKTNLYYKFGNFFKFKEVNLKNFEQYSEGIIKKLLEKKVEKIIIIGIIKPYKALLKSEIINEEIVLYNEVFRELSIKYSVVSYIDIYNDSDEDFTIWDGYHYSQKASKYLADTIKKIVIND